MADMVDTNSFKNGMHIELDGKVWRILEFQHVKPGKGGAFVRTKLKSLDAGAVVDRTFRAGEKFPRVHTEVKNVQYLYDDGSDVHFMDSASYEQFAVPHSEIEDELELLRRACAVTDRVFERLTEVSFVGRTERDVSWDLAQLFHEEGGEDLAFESIVGAGPTGSRPHARAGDRKIGAGELVVIDAGCTIGGYASDYTRTFATGPLDSEAKDAYEVVLLAQQAALDGIHAGISGVDADALARSVIDDSPFAGKLGHGLGHGLGLDVHEAPRLSKESNDVLEPGNVVTVEPGVYVEGKFGIRIEDDVVVTPDGIENLTGFRKDLIEVS